MAVGALASGGIAGITYSIEHKDEQSAGKFWGGFATTVAVNAAIGGIAGAATALTAPARLAAAFPRVGAAASTAARALLGGATNVVSTAAQRGVENVFYGKHQDLFEGAASTFIMGALAGGAAGGYAAKGASKAPVFSNPANKLLGINKFEGSFKLRSFTGVRQILEPKPMNPWANLTSAYVKEGLWAGLSQGGTLGLWAAREVGLVAETQGYAMSYLDSAYKALDF